MRVLFTMGLLAVALGMGVGRSYGASCHDLWVERNQYFKDAGYCFETRNAIEYFGNGGCWIHGQNNVRLSPTARMAVEQIATQESRQGCGY